MCITFFSRIEVVQEGKEPLNHCDLCGIRIAEGRLIKHQRMRRCNRNMHMWWRRRDVVIVSRCADASFSLTGEDEVECIEGVDTFKYQGRMLDRSDDDWPELIQNVRKARRVWRRIGKLLRREGEDP